MVSWDRAKRNPLRSQYRSIPWCAKRSSGGKNSPFIASQKIGFLRAGIAMESNRTGDKQFCTSIYDQRLGNLELKRNLAGIHSGTPTQPS